MWTVGPALALLAVAVLTACSREKPPRPAATVPVVVGTAVRRPMPVRVTAIGNVRPDESVTVRSEVTGQMATVHFEEGSDLRRASCSSRSTDARSRRSPGGGRNTGLLFVRLKPRDQRASADSVVADLRPRLARVPGLRTFL